MPTSPPRFHPRLLLALLAAVACRGDSGRGNDTAGGPPSPPPPVEAGRPAAIAWDTTAGLYFALPAEHPAQAFVIDATYAAASTLDTLHVDTLRLQRTTFDLLGGGGVVGTARVGSFPGDSAERCAGWPIVSLVPATAAPLPAEWKVAFAAARVRSVPFDSLPALAAADSARRVVALARAASTVEGDTATAFRGRPFVVRQANRVDFDGGEVVFAEVARTVQQEATPLQEQLLLILERADSLATGRGYEVRFAERAIALEEAIESVELVAALRVARTGVPSLLLRRESEAGTAFLLLQRAADGEWFVRWRSATAGC